MSAEEHLLVIESDALRARSLAQLLSTAGYQISCVETGHAALEVFDRQNPDLLLLNVTLPDMSGIELLELIRRVSGVPVIMLGDDARDSMQVRSLEAGADDFITRPYYEEELLARITALLRRIQWTPQIENVLQVGPLRVETSRRRATLRGRMLHLTPIEFSILCTLMEHAGQLVTYEELLDNVWGATYEGSFSVLRVNISRLRQKIEDNAERPHYIQTVPRQGYRMPG